MTPQMQEGNQPRPSPKRTVAGTNVEFILANTVLRTKKPVSPLTPKTRWRKAETRPETSESGPGVLTVPVAGSDGRGPGSPLRPPTALGLEKELVGWGERSWRSASGK